MAGVNKVILIGNLGRDPELRYTQSGQPVANFTMATTESWNKRDGSGREEKTEWHRIVAWGRTAELCAQYLAKGRTVYVEGRLQTREWEDREGKKQRTTEIVAQTVQFLGGNRGAGAAGALAPAPPALRFPPRNCTVCATISVVRCFLPSRSSHSRVWSRPST